MTELTQAEKEAWRCPKCGDGLQAAGCLACVYKRSPTDQAELVTSPTNQGSPPANDDERCQRTVHSFNGMVRCLLADGHSGFHSYEPATNQGSTADEQSLELRKHQDLVEALKWLPAGTVVDFYDLDYFLEEMRARPARWLPIRECEHKPGYARCLQCRHAEDD